MRPNCDEVILESNEQNWFKRLQNDDSDLAEFRNELNDEEIEYGDESKQQTQVTAPDSNSLFLNPDYYDV